nr:p22 [Norwalk-like virus]
GPTPTTFNFDRNKVLAFRQLAAENKYGLMDTMRVGKQLKDVRTMPELRQALKNISIKSCQIVYGGCTYMLESDGKGDVKVDRVQNATVQTNNELAGALHHLRCARIRYYVKCIQEALYSIIQIAGAAFVTTRIVKRMNIQDLWSKPQVEDTEETASKDGCPKPKDDDEFVVSSDDIKTE